MPREPIGEEAREVVEEGMTHRFEPEEVTVGCGRRAGRERAEPLVLPDDVVASLRPMGDAKPPVARESDQASITEQRTEDHLELDGVRREPPECRTGMFDHQV